MQLLQGLNPLGPTFEGLLARFPRGHVCCIAIRGLAALLGPCKHIDRFLLRSEAAGLLGSVFLSPLRGLLDLGDEILEKGVAPCEKIIIILGGFTL